LRFGGRTARFGFPHLHRSGFLTTSLVASPSGLDCSCPSGSALCGSVAVLPGSVSLTSQIRLPHHWFGRFSLQARFLSPFRSASSPSGLALYCQVRFPSPVQPSFLACFLRPRIWTSCHIQKRVRLNPSIAILALEVLCPEGQEEYSPQANNPLD
jgi:hypothetical protein